MCERQVQGRMIRVATYNIRKCVGLDWRRRPDRIVHVLRELRADVVAVQEADRRFGTRASTLPPDALEVVAGLRPVPVGGREASSGWHGNALLVGEDAEVRDVRCIDLPSFEPRGALIADLSFRGETLRVAGVHLGLRAADRARQARTLVRALEEYDDGVRTVILGDLNEWRPGGPAMAEFSRGYRSSPFLPSFHTSAPLAALDRILVGPGLGIGTAGVHRSPVARRASDHLPVWADIVSAEPGRPHGGPAKQEARTSQA